MAVATQPSLAAQLQNFGQLSNGQKIGLIIAAGAIIALKPMREKCTCQKLVARRSAENSANFSLA